MTSEEYWIVHTTTTQEEHLRYGSSLTHSHLAPNNSNIQIEEFRAIWAI